MHLTLLPLTLAICRLSPQTALPVWVWSDTRFLSITYTDDELSIVCVAESIPSTLPEVQCEKNWRAIKIQGPLDFALTGILAMLAAPLAAAGISIFALSTFDTDYVLVREQDVLKAQETLEHNGHIFG